MSLPSINVNSLLSAMGSGVSGIDVSTTVAQLIQAKRAPEYQWQQDIQDLQTQASLLNQFSSAVSSLTDKLNALQSPIGAMATMKTTSSDPNLVSASAIPGTAAGNHTIVVSNLATTGSWYTDAVASATTQLAAGSFSLQVGSGATTSIEVGNGVNTLNDLASYINGKNLGVTANVVTDATGARLALVSQTSGQSGDISITGASGLSFTQAAKGVNASLTVDGIPISSESNVVTGAVNGLTLNLLGANPNSSISVSISSDNTAATQAINDFVNSYNSLIKGVNAQFTYNGSTKTSGPLASDPSMKLLQDALLSISGYSQEANTNVSSLAKMGVSMNNDGTLSVDSSALSNALQNNFANVRNFLQGDSSNGFANFLNKQLGGLLNPTEGAFSVDLKSNTAQQKNVQNQIDDFEVYIASEQTRLTTQYNNVAIMLQQLPMQIQQIQAALGNSNWGSSK